MEYNNNLNLLRLFFSLNVLLYHCSVLSQSAKLNFVSHFLKPDLAVQGFFIVSGYLIFKSYKRSSGVKGFYIKRIRRIYPAYITVILLSTFLGIFISNLSPGGYFKSVLLYKYILFNSVFLNFLQQSLPGVFTSNHLGAVNGALWTLKIEVGFYLIVPLLFWIRQKTNTHLFYIGVIVLSLIYYSVTAYLFATTHQDIYQFISRQLPGQLFFFMLGAYFSEFEDNLFLRKTIRIAGLPCVILLLFYSAPFLEILCLIVAVFFIAFIIPAINYPYKKEDISYGLYIYHFPVIQIFIHFMVYEQYPVTGLLLSIACTFIMAVLSWKYIEKPFIANNKIRMKTAR